MQVGLDSLHEMGQYPFHQTLVECVQLDKRTRGLMPQGQEQAKPLDDDANPVTYEQIVGACRASS